MRSESGGGSPLSLGNSPTLNSVIFKASVTICGSKSQYKLRAQVSSWSETVLQYRLRFVATHVRTRSGHSDASVTVSPQPLSPPGHGTGLSWDPSDQLPLCFFLLWEAARNTGARDAGWESDAFKSWLPCAAFATKPLSSPVFHLWKGDCLTYRVVFIAPGPYLEARTHYQLKKHQFHHSFLFSVITTTTKRLL